jgi:excisionase family DNA binding protein
MNIATVKEVSALLKVKSSTLYSWVGSGSIPHLRLNGVIRFDLDDIKQWALTSRTTKQNPLPFPRKQKSNGNVDEIVKRAIDSTKGKRYNTSTGNQADIRVSGRRHDGTV